MLTADQLKKLHIGAEWVDALNETLADSTSPPNANKRPLSGNADMSADTSRHWRRILITALKR